VINYLLEACVDSVESAIAASKGGAARLELCSNLIIGGTTPGSCLYQEIRKHCDTKIHILIRPRFGDFCYSEYEFQVMKEEVAMFRELGAEGIVIGILTPEGSLDVERMEELITLAGGMSVTLHRAFDVCANPYQALEEAVSLGVSTILTSGQESNCMKGRELIGQLVKKSEGRLSIMAGAGVSAKIIPQLYTDTKVNAFHMSGKATKDSLMTYRKENVNMGLPSLSEYEIWQTQEQMIRAAWEILQQITSADREM